MNNELHAIQYTTNLFFVRHAQSEHNATKLVAGRQETPLTEKGKAQAQQTAEFFSSITMDHILYSPLLRAQHTAEIIFQHNKCTSFSLCEDIVEIDTGEFSNRTIADIKETESQKYYQFLQKSWEGVSGAESIATLLKRCNNMWNTLIRLINTPPKNTDDTSNSLEKNILVLTHGGFLQWIFKTSHGIQGNHVETWAPIIRTSNCGIYQLTITPTVVPDEGHKGVHAIWNLLNHTCYN